MRAVENRHIAFRRSVHEIDRGVGKVQIRAAELVLQSIVDAGSE